jgi:aminopeptidase-like protein
MSEPSQTNAETMWALAERLFPLHRTLVGPGFAQSLEMIKEILAIDVAEFASGTQVFDWVIPLGFKVNEAYVEAPDGSRPIDFAKHCYHVWNYSQSFHGVMSRAELADHLAVVPDVPKAIPLRVTYYRPRWGLSASQEQVAALPDGDYTVHIDTDHFSDFLRIGEYFLPGETDQEILINSYLCHPHGANDNLSGVVVAVELMKLLSALPHRRYSYRLAIWPETIGSVTYIASYPERIAKTVAVLPLACCADPGKFHYKKSFLGDTALDRAMIHALKHSGFEHVVREYNPIGGDERQFNTSALRLPCGLLTRTPANEFDEYHTHLDDLTFIDKQSLFETLQVAWTALMALERNRVYEPHYVTEPFLSGHDIYPYDLGMGSGERGGIFNRIGLLYYSLIPNLDGQTDLLEIAEKLGEDIQLFDRPIGDFLAKDLISEVRVPFEGVAARSMDESAWRTTPSGMIDTTTADVTEN